MKKIPAITLYHSTRLSIHCRLFVTSESVIDYTNRNITYFLLVITRFISMSRRSRGFSPYLEKAVTILTFNTQVTQHGQTKKITTKVRLAPSVADRRNRSTP
ncbi:MAG: hypothetical protein ACJ04P_08810, partial [Halioglobus sp.]